MLFNLPILTYYFNRIRSLGNQSYLDGLFISAIYFKHIVLVELVAVGHASAKGFWAKTVFEIGRLDIYL